MSRKRTSFESSRCVPMTMSTLPSARPASVRSCSFGGTNRLRIPIFTGKAANRARNVSWCCAARTVVGTRTATCFPSWVALNAPRSATSVLPYPTSPTTSRSIGRPASMSCFISRTARSWSTVSSYGKLASISACQGESGEYG